MKHIVRKAYWDYEKEEHWLNEMSGKGLQLSNYSWCKYTFSEGEIGEYIYRIELLDHYASHPESQAYLRFLEESGVEHVASYQRWVYLRKKSSGEPFEVYTDIESRIKYYSRVNKFWTALGFAELAIGIANLVIAASHIATEIAGTATKLNIFFGAFCSAVGIAFLLLSRPLRRKIRRLKKEGKVHQ